MKLQFTPERLLRRQEAAQYLQARGVPITPQSLAKMAVIGGGPIFRKCGKFPLYSPADLDTWISEKLSKPIRSSAELSGGTIPQPNAHMRAARVAAHSGTSKLLAAAVEVAQ